MSAPSPVALATPGPAFLDQKSPSEPESLKFGTSGLRGLVTDLIGLPTRAYSHAFVLHVLDKAPQTSHVLVGRDLRSSSEAIASDCMAAIRQAGLDPVDCGELPTPALALQAQRRGFPAIMVTGSHIPDDRNGLKFYLPSGEIAKSDERAILAIHEGFDEATLRSLADAVPGAVSSDHEACARYIDRYVSFFGADSLNGLRVVVYQHSSVARDVLVELLRAMGADVDGVGRAECFVPVDTEAHDPEQIAYIQRIARSERFDAIVSTDGDADRPLVADEVGHILRGDVLGLLAAKLLNMQTIVTPVTSGSVIEACGFAKHVIRTRVGSPYVVAAMEEAQLMGKGSIIGFEANGGTLLQTSVTGPDGRLLEALPTRDAVLPILASLIPIKRPALPLSKIVQGLDIGHALADRLKDVPSALSLQFLKRLAEEENFAESYFREVGEVVAMSQLDGVRFQFGDGTVIHYRASGNAPELRCYVEAKEENRASELLKWGLQAAQHQLARKGNLPI